MSKEKQYSVYKHTFPNGKCYIGISNDPIKRWREGKGYKSQTKMAKAIKRYGWENVKHEILCDGLSVEQAKKLEQEFISAFDSIENGYNNTIGGDHITTTYLNSHIMEMIRESKLLDVQYGETQKEDDIVSIAEKGKTDKVLADLLNRLDEIIEEYYHEYKQYYGQNGLVDLHSRRVDCYWWYMAELFCKRKPQDGDYQSALYKYYFSKEK